MFDGMSEEGKGILMSLGVRDAHDLVMIYGLSGAIDIIEKYQGEK